MSQTWREAGPARAGPPGGLRVVVRGSSRCCTNSTERRRELGGKIKSYHLTDVHTEDGPGDSECDRSLLAHIRVYCAFED